MHASAGRVRRLCPPLHLAPQAHSDNHRDDYHHSRDDDGQLQLLGWGGRRSRTVTVTEPPGQPRTLEVIREGKNWIFLDWKESMEGGEVAAYRVQRRTRDNGDWMDVGMSVESEVTLRDREPGVEWQSRVTAVNRKGEGKGSDVVAVPRMTAEGAD